MKLRYALVFAFILVLSMSTAASATYYASFFYDADCEGWSVNGSIHFGGGVTVAHMDYYVRLTQGSEVIAEFTGTPDILSDNPVFSFSDVWGMELCGDYTVSGSFYFTTVGTEYGIKNFEFMITCECGDDECTYTPGFWKNHPEEWPADNLDLGPNNYTAEELMYILHLPAEGGDLLLKMVHHLIAAKFNVLNGSDAYIQEYIDMGDDFLVDYPLYSTLKGTARETAEDIKDHLAAYNEIECDEDDTVRSIEILKLDIKTPTPSMMDTPEDDTSWGKLKKLKDN